MEEKNGLHRMLESMQTGILDQINALKNDVEGAKSDVETMLNLSSALEDKTTSQEKFREATMRGFSYYGLHIWKTGSLAFINNSVLRLTILIVAKLSMANANKKKDWRNLLMGLINELNKSQSEINNAKNVNSLIHIMNEFHTKLIKILIYYKLA